MKGKKATKRALLSSALSLVLCFSMLLGTTFAWFTDEASTAVNTIQAGTLEVVLEYKDASGNWVDANGKTLDFIKDADAPENEEILWEPGCTYELPAIRVGNAGNLWLKYEIAITGIDGDAKLNEAIEWTYNGEAASAFAGFEGTLAPAEGENNNYGDYENGIVISGHMKEDAGNEYQDLKIEGIAITVFATQKDAEFDSFDNQYDVNATIGTPIYTTEEFYTALAEGTGAVCLNLMSNDVVWTTGAEHGSTPLVAADSKITSLTINGNGKTLTFDGSGVGSVRAANGAKVTFNNVNVVDESVSYAEDAWEFTYLEFAGVLEFNDCTFNSGIQLQTEGEESVLNATFTDCEFITNESSVYAVWVSDGVSTFENCSFTGTRGLKMHEAYGSEVASVVIDNCVFDLTDKPGVAIGKLNADTSVSITNSIFDCDAGDQGLYIYETDTDVATFTFVESNNRVGAVEIVAPGVVETATRTYKVYGTKGLMNLSSVFAELNADDSTKPGEGKGYTVELMGDVDLAGQTWEPINSMWVTFNGNGHTISNLTAGMAADGRRSGFWGYAGAVTINDLTLENVTVSGSQAGTFAGSGDGLKLNNCYLKGDNVVNFVAGVEEWNGIGAITGVLTSSNVNVEIVEGATVTLNRGEMQTAYGCAYVDDLTGHIQANNGNVTNNGTVTASGIIQYAVSTNEELEDALKDLNAKNIVVNLTSDLSVNVTGGASEVFGGEDTETVTINGNGYTLTFNHLSGDWNNIITAGAKLIINNAHVTNSGRNDGPWNRHDLNFACEVEMNNVTSDKAMAFKAGATLNNVTINDANTSDTYAIWIQPKGQTVTLNGCTIDMLDCTDGRGIKIDEEYVVSPAKVTLKVSKTTFKTEEKAAILVNSSVGADINIDNIDISGVAADTVNAVWVDSDAAGSANLVTVTGANKIVEP